MPIYAYRCSKCGEQEEHIQRFSDPPLESCAACGGRLEKLLSAAAFHLKGGGWYKDGYASTNGTAAKTESKSDSTSSDSGAAKKADSTPKAAAE